MPSCISKTSIFLGGKHTGGTSISPCSYGFACRTKGWEFTPQPSAGSIQAVCGGVLQLEAEEKAASTGWQQRTWNGEAQPGARCRLADTGPMRPAPGTPRHRGALQGGPPCPCEWCWIRLWTPILEALGGGKEEFGSRCCTAGCSSSRGPGANLVSCFTRERSSQQLKSWCA